MGKGEIELNPFWLGKPEKCESPRYEDFVTSFGCAFEYYAILIGLNSPCDGSIEFHHFPLRSQGGGSSSGCGLCRKHHRAYHAGDEYVMRFVREWIDSLNVRYHSAYLNLIERLNGEAPATQRTARKTTRRNRGEMTKKFIPLSER